MKKLFVLLLSITILSLGSTQVTYARHGADDSTSHETTEATTQSADVKQEDKRQDRQETRQEDRKQDRQEDKAQTQEQRQEDRQAKKKQLCESRHHGITSSLSAITANQQRKIDRLTTITDKVEDYYKNKNLSVENYGALTADVDTKKQAALSAISELKNLEGTFTCDSDNPRAQIDTFKQKHAASINAIKEYKTAVKNLLTAVKSAAATPSTSTN